LDFGWIDGLEEFGFGTRTGEALREASEREEVEHATCVSKGKYVSSLKSVDKPESLMWMVAPHSPGNGYTVRSRTVGPKLNISVIRPVGWGSARDE
jgi:hypothetical protein